MSRSAPDVMLAAVLRGLRFERGMSQEALAFDANVTVSALSRLERGLSDPLWGNVRAITGALGVSLGELEAALERERQRALLAP